MPDISPTLYTTLELTEFATNREIRAAYRRLAKKHHPDTNKGNSHSTETFKRLNSAFRVLGDSAARRVYDRKLASQRRGRQSGRVTNDVTNVGRNVKIKLYITLEQARKGGVRKLRYPRDTSCLVCKGTGIHSQKKLDCAACGGMGIVRVDHQVTVKYDAGVLHGEVIGMSGAGHSDKANIPPGDLLVTIYYKKHPYFDFNGPDLHYRALITLEEYIEGGTIKVPTMTGFSSIDVPPRFGDGGSIRLTGRGLPPRYGASKGDIVVTINHCVPKKLSSKERLKLKELLELSGFRVPVDLNGVIPLDRVTNKSRAKSK